jgi:hypothetical protein
MKKASILLLGLVVAAAAILFLKARAQVASCTTDSDHIIGYSNGNNPVTINVDDPNNMQGIAIDLESGNLDLRLKEKGANFIPGSNYPVTTNYRMTGAAGDFNGDGYVDLIEGGRGTDYNTNGSLGNTNDNDTNISFFVSRGKDPNDATRFKFEGPYYLLYNSRTNTTYATYEIIACGAGDFDKDGDIDIAVLTWQGRLLIFKNLYVENGLSPGGIPQFSTTPTVLGDLINDGYTEWGQGSSNFRWESNIESVDIDGDGDQDLIVGVPTRWASNRWGEVVIFINNGHGVFSRLATSINPYPNNSSYIYGVAGVAAADFDRDGDIDFYAGGPNSRDIYFYRNDGLGNFSKYNQRTITIPQNHGSCTMLRAGNMDGDQDIDLVLATDGWTTNPPGGYVYWYKNDGTGVMTAICVPTTCAQMSSSADLDSGAIGDFDKDGDLDFFVADGNDSQRCYFVMNDTYPLYVPQGTVYSMNLLPCSFIQSDHAVVAATLTRTDSAPAGTTITYYLSNNNDENGNPLWEGPVTPGTEFMFASPGWFLRWEAILTTSDETKTPRIIHIRIDYRYLNKREYSRTSHAFTMADVNSGHEGNEEVLFSASFEFPSWRGHLRSWDLTNLTLTNQRGSTIQEIKDAGASYVADAGEVLTATSWDSRQVFTAQALDADSVMNDRLEFNVSNGDALEPFLGLGIGSPETAPLIQFVLGHNRTWKLGDINHSSPQVLEAPSGIPALMGTGYDEFKTSHADRPRSILVGANDGMLHCFHPATLEEQWAFIPNNLLYKLKKMRIVDPDCGEYLYHHYFVDGTPAIHDVYFGGAWHTVVVCGQGPGWGKDHNWYYFCVDVTDPANPRPLWEYNDPDSMGETWSVPAIGKLPSTGRWVAFFGSGYDTDGDASVDLGNHFYCVDIENGEELANIHVKDNPEPSSPYGIQNTIPGSPAEVDTDNDGMVDAVYFGDLLGRIWKVDTTGDPSHWKADAIYKDPYMYPIVTKPAISYSISDHSVHLYFGTGGDEKAPSNADYSFVALRDAGGTQTVEWFIGTDAFAAALGIDAGLKKDTFAHGEKVWADDIIADGIVYIATVNGSIENINPCLTLSGSGQIYARYTTGSRSGSSALTDVNGNAITSLATLQKVRSAVTIGSTTQVGSENKRKVFIQSYTQPGEEGGPEPPSQVLAQPIAAMSKLKIKSWREVYQIIH